MWFCLLHSIRDRAKKEKSPRSVGASGVKCFVFNNFEQKLLKKIFHSWIHWKKFEKHLHWWFHWTKIEKNFHWWFHWKKIEKNFHCWFHWKKSKKISTADVIEKIRKKFPLLISLKKKSKKISTADFIEKNLTPHHRWFL